MLLTLKALLCVMSLCLCFLRSARGTGLDRCAPALSGVTVLCTTPRILAFGLPRPRAAHCAPNFDTGPYDHELYSSRRTWHSLHLPCAVPTKRFYSHPSDAAPYFPIPPHLRATTPESSPRPTVTLRRGQCNHAQFIPTPGRGGRGWSSDGERRPAASQCHYFVLATGARSQARRSHLWNLYKDTETYNYF